MNVQLVFRKIAAKLAADFDISAEVKHGGSKGALREDALRRFLEERVPGSCGTGAGEIVGPRNDTSQQCDLIIYDRLRGVPLVYGESTQVYPIECVYGTIEVKSGLSKDKLIDALEKIRSVKALVPTEAYLSIPASGPVTHAVVRPRPFGIVFAYRLDDNSLKSLAENLSHWEANVSPEFWPNLVVVLHEGVILHSDEQGHLLLQNADLRGGHRTIGLGYREDSLFHAYAAILDMVSATPLGPTDIRRYYDLPKLVGPYSVRNHDRFVRTSPKANLRLKQAFIERIIAWCKDRPLLSEAEILIKATGQLPVGTGQDDHVRRIHFYDPEELPGTHQVEKPFAAHADGTRMVRTQSPSWWLEVDGETYWFAQAYMSTEDFEEF